MPERMTDLVREHRTTIAIVVPLVGAVLLVASEVGVLPAILAYNAVLVLSGTLVMRLPLAATLRPLLDRRAALALTVLVGYTYAIEAVGLATGWPYGTFEYVATLGPMVAGVPVALPVFFVPLALNAVLLASLLLGPTARWRRAPLAVGLLVGVDLILDPAAVAVGFWTYGGGAYYGVPLSNYGGWLLSAAVAVALIEVAFDADALADRIAACEFALDDFVSFTVLWGLLNLAYGNWIPVGLTLALVATLARLDRFDLVVGGDPTARGPAGQ